MAVIEEKPNWIENQWDFLVFTCICLQFKDIWTDIYLKICKKQNIFMYPIILPIFLFFFYYSNLPFFSCFLLCFVRNCRHHLRHYLSYGLYKKNNFIFMLNPQIIYLFFFSTTKNVLSLLFPKFFIMLRTYINFSSWCYKKRKHKNI